MRRIEKVITFSIIMIFLLSGCRSDKFPSDEGRETVLDRTVYIEDALVTELPRVEKWCDRLSLKKNRVNVGDCKLYVEEEGKGMPVVLLHGGPGSTHHNFHPYFSHAKKFARIIYYDQRGCGISDYERGDRYTIDQAVQDLESLRRNLNLKKWIVLGHSYGGLLAQYYATQHPESFAGLVLVGSSTGMHARLKPTRQYDYISDEENQRMRGISKEVSELVKAGKIPQERSLELIVFNNHLNGDWKRQNFYKPTREELAYTALYGWKPAPNFRRDMHFSVGKVDLDGAFENCPIPTLVMEGKWDLTWNTDKPEILHKNHPNARLIMFERSAHSPFEDEPEQFFSELKSFIKNLPEVADSKFTAWKNSLKEWEKEKADPFLVGEMSEEERIAIAEFYQIRENILQGQKYKDQSTPLHTFLTKISAHHFADLETYNEVRPGEKTPANTEEMAKRKKELADDEKWFIKDEILRAPLPPQNPKPFQLWPIYLKYESKKELGETYIFIFWKGKRRWAGNVAIPRNWRYSQDFFLTHFKDRVGIK